MRRARDVALDEAALACGVMRRTYARTTHSGSHIRGQLAARRWQQPTPRVLVLHNGPLTYEQQLWVALLECPMGSALAGLTAAELDGLKGFSDKVTVAIHDGARKPELDWVTVWRSSGLTEADVHPVRQPRRTRPARSLLDAASRSNSPSRARAILLAGCQQRIVLPEHLT